MICALQSCPSTALFVVVEVPSLAKYIALYSTHAAVLPEIFSENVLFGENFLKFHGILIFIAFLLLNILTSTYLKSTLGTSSGNPDYSRKKLFLINDF